MPFSTITKGDVGKTIVVLAKVEHIHQTSGPTLFKLFDGTAHFVAKAFLNPGERAYPKIEKDMVVEVELRIQEYEGKLEGGIASMGYKDAALFEQQLQKIRDAQVRVDSIPFLVPNEILEKLRERIEQAALLIKKAVVEKRQILLRHNADCDGYCGAVALERAILTLLYKHHNDDYAQWKFYKRLPSKAPFYSVTDGLLDVSSVANEVARGGKAPLLIIVDNGSGGEDVLSIKNMKVYSCPIIVVDHHFIKQDVVSEHVDVHINPYLVGGNSQLCAGMLSVELSRFIASVDVGHLAAVAGVGDKVESEEMKQYVALAGYPPDFIKKLALCIDYAAYYIRAEGRAYVHDLLGIDKERQKRMVELLYEDARSKMQQALAVAQHYVQIEKNGKTIAVLDLGSVSLMGEFPAFGKITGLVSDWLNESNKHVYVLGAAKDMIVLRVSKGEVFNLNDVVSILREKMQYACISGGGHERAGTIRFVAAAKDEVVDFVKGYISRS